MTTLKRFLLLVAFCSSATIANAQNFKVPEKYSFDSPEAYHKYDKDIVKCVNWLEHTPPGEDDDKVKKAGRFLLEWLSGCPYVRFTTNVRIDNFLGDSPEYRIYYMGGWAKYALESNAAKPDKRLCTFAGIKSVIKVYKSQSQGKKDANIEELVKMDEQSRLKSWVDERS